MPISIFAQPAHTNTDPAHPYVVGVVRTGHLQRVSSIIRGEQIAERIGARLNPADGYQDDVCVYVKPHVKDGRGFEFEGRSNWLDIIDGWRLCELARANPRVGVIACSQADGDLLRRSIPNRVLVIPQHHCNFERTAHRRRPIQTIGVIGTERAFTLLPRGLEAELAQRGIKLECFSKFYTRRDICDFYQRIDVQLVWRPYRMRLANPLKIVNASAFGVPTVALEEACFEEIYHLPARNLETLLYALDQLSQPRFYNTVSDIGLEASEAYHIDRIAEMYAELE